MLNLHKLRLSDGPGFPRLWNRLLEELERNTIASVSSPLLLSGDGKGYRLGIILPDATRQADAFESPFPWQIFQSPADPVGAQDWRNVRVRLGKVNGKTTTDAKFCDQVPGAPTGGYDILVPADTYDYKIWGKATFTRLPFCSRTSGAVKVNTVRIQHGTSWWSGYPAQYPTAGEFYFEIGRVTTGVDSPQWLDAPTNTVPNPDWHQLVITQIASADQWIYNHPILLVNLSSDGGVAGDPATNCSLTYTATDLCGVKVGAGLTPLTGRMEKMQYTVGTKGYVTWDGSGLPKLAIALDELPVPVEALIAVVTSKDGDGCYTIEPHMAKLLGYNPSVTEPA